MRSKSSHGKLSSLHLVSWMARTSQSLRSSHASTRSARARREFTFQVAIFTATNLPNLAPSASPHEGLLAAMSAPREGRSVGVHEGRRGAPAHLDAADDQQQPCKNGEPCQQTHNAQEPEAGIDQDREAKNRSHKTSQQPDSPTIDGVPCCKREDDLGKTQDQGPESNQDAKCCSCDSWPRDRHQTGGNGDEASHHRPAGMA